MRLHARVTIDRFQPLIQHHFRDAVGIFEYECVRWRRTDRLDDSLADPGDGACGSAVALADGRGHRRRLNVVSGILRDVAAELRPDLDGDRARG